MWMRVEPRRRHNSIGSKWLKTFEDFTIDERDQDKTVKSLFHQDVRTKDQHTVGSSSVSRVTGINDIGRVVLNTAYETLDPMDHDLLPIVDSNKKKRLGAAELGKVSTSGLDRRHQEPVVGQPIEFEQSRLLVTEDLQK